MKVEVITTAMNTNGFELVSQMNIETDAVIANQSQIYDYQSQIIKGRNVKLVTTNTNGASLNRNIGIAHSSGDILLFTDDDTELVPDYERLILSEFQKNDSIDAIKFFAESKNQSRPLAFRRPKQLSKAKLSTLMSSGIVTFAIKRSRLIELDIRFNNNIGPGRKINHGEDGLFYKKLLDSGVNVYISPVLLGKIKQETSSWFKGYDEEYFCTCGYIYKQLYGHLAILAIIRRAIKEKNSTEHNFSKKELIGFMKSGLKK